MSAPSGEPGRAYLEVRNRFESHIMAVCSAGMLAGNS